MKTVISTNKAPSAIGPYSQGTVHNNVLYVSGQLPLCPQSGQMVSGDITQEVTQVMQNIKAIVEAAGGKMESMLKATILLTDLGDFDAVNKAYAEFFPTTEDKKPPARICYQVVALPRGARVEIDAICAL